MKVKVFKRPRDLEVEFLCLLKGSIRPRALEVEILLRVKVLKRP